MRSPGGGELSLSTCPGVGNRPPSKKKIANPRGCARGGMVTGRIEPCISPSSIRSDEGLTLETSAFHGGHSVKLLANLHIRALLTVKD